MRTWLQWLALFLVAIMGERLLLGMTSSFFAIGALTSAAFAAPTVTLFSDWWIARGPAHCPCCARRWLDYPGSR
jgi:hypothetical protein